MVSVDEIVTSPALSEIDTLVPADNVNVSLAPSVLLPALTLLNVFVSVFVSVDVIVNTPAEPSEIDTLVPPTKLIFPVLYVPVLSLLTLVTVFVLVSVEDITPAFVMETLVPAENASLTSAADN